MKARPKKIGSADEDTELWKEFFETTKQECEEGWAPGPWSEEQLDAKFGKVWNPALRKGISQKGKIRPVDDLTVRESNETVTSKEMIDLGGINEIESFASKWTEALTRKSR